MTIMLGRTLSVKGDGAQNEDHLGSEGDCVWILDGATGVSDSVLGHESDARWYVERFNCDLADTIRANPAAPTQQLISDAIRAVRHTYLTAFKGLATPEHAPSAAFMLLRGLNGAIELSALGDCAALYRKPNGSIGFFEGTSIARFETAALQRLRDEQACSPDADHAAVISRVSPVLRANRSRMNQPDGYWILSMEEEAAHHIETVIVETARDSPILLMTDGFTRAFQSLELMSLQEAYEAIERHGLDDLAAQIRQRETSDANCRLYPRFKKSDDATCIEVRQC